PFLAANHCTLRCDLLKHQKRMKLGFKSFLGDFLGVIFFFAKKVLLRAFLCFLECIRAADALTPLLAFSQKE
ncbi:hypothetical protein UD03_03800, partial [Campylobacter coli]